jgi:hypothetical protein
VITVSLKNKNVKYTNGSTTTTTITQLSTVQVPSLALFTTSSEDLARHFLTKSQEHSKASTASSKAETTLSDPDKTQKHHNLVYLETTQPS